MGDLLIGLAGLARSGKDTAASYMAKELGLFTYSFAGPLKDMLRSAFGNHFHGGDRERICKETGVSYRVMMQTLGTEWARSLHPDVWTNLAKTKWEWVKGGCPVDHSQSILQNVVMGALDQHSGMVISDVRFDNEAEWIRSEGGIIIHVERDSAEKVGTAGHASEAGLTKIHGDLVVENNSTLEAYHDALDYLIALLKNPSRSRPAAGIAYEFRL